MSSPTDSSTKWKILAAVFVITTIIGFATTAYYYNSLNNANSQNSDLAAKNSDLKNTLASDTDQISSLNGQITTLNGQITTDKAQIVYLQTQLNGNVTQVQELQKQVDQLNATIATDQATIMTLEAEVAKLTDVDFTTGKGSVIFSCGFLSTCTPVAIEFNNTADHKILSSVVLSDGTYSVWLANGQAYSVTLVYLSTGFLGLFTSIATCTPIPSTFTPTTNPASQNFTC